MRYISLAFFSIFFLSAKPSRGHGWCQGSHINPVQPQSGGTDTSLHLPESPISGRLNKLQLIGSWRQTRQAHFIAVWRQPFQFPSVACWVLKLERCLMSDAWPRWTTWLPCFEREQKYASDSVFKRCYRYIVHEIKCMNNSQIIYSSRCTAMQNCVSDPTSCGQHKEATAYHPWHVRMSFLEKT